MCVVSVKTLKLGLAPSRAATALAVPDAAPPGAQSSAEPQFHPRGPGERLAAAGGTDPCRKRSRRPEAARLQAEPGACTPRAVVSREVGSQMDTSSWLRISAERPVRGAAFPEGVNAEG